MKKKIFIIILVIIILILGISFGIAEYIKQRDNKISLMQDEVIIEYGQTYNPSLEDLVDLQKFDYMDVGKVKIEPNIDNEENKEYPAVGEYEIRVNYKDKTLKQKIKVVDTIAPELSIQENIEIEYNTDLSTFDFKNYITTSDLSQLKDYNIDLAKVNTSTSGEYETTVTIEDIHGNQTEQKFKIKVLEKVEEPKENVQKEAVTENKTNNSNKNKVSNPTTNPTTKEEIKNNSTKPEEKQQDKKEEKPNQTTNDNTNQDVIVDIVQDASKCTHGKENYFDSQEEAVAFCKNTIKQYGDELKSGKIETYEEYARVCPYGYETISCPYCGKWTISFYYNTN